MLALLRHLGCSRPDVDRCPTERGASFLLKPSMKPMRAKSTSQFSAALEHRETAPRFKFRLEDGMRSRGPVSNTVKLSANLERRDIHDLVECPLLEADMVYHLRHLDKLECRGTARRFAAECDPVECVSAQRGGQSCENCATDRRRQWCRQRRCILGVCAHLALPTVRAEQTQAFSPKKSELLGPWSITDRYLQFDCATFALVFTGTALNRGNWMMMGTQCLHEARLPLFNGCSERTQCRPRVQHPDRRVCFLERHYRLNCAIKKAMKRPKRICRPVNWASGAFCTAPKPTIDESLLNKSDAIDDDTEDLQE